ncbi:MAG: ABC transporter ATP-binding protein [bacterium]|nr:ABC transporter ATP-binding protein [bacterium]
MSALLEARGLRKSFSWRGQWGGERRLWAVDGVDLEVGRGECLALVGESGSGKTTLGRCLLRLLEPDAGTVRFAGTDLLALSDRDLRRRRTELQMVFQDSAGALDPRLRVGAQIAEPIRIHRLAPGADVEPRVAALLETVGLARSLAERYPHQLSGGQRQRVGIARALATEPRLLILDEPVSALDVSVRAQLLGLLQELRSRLQLTMIFIAHDLAMVEQIADRVAVMYLGRLIEMGPSREVFAAPRHPYTASLLAAVPVPDPKRRSRLATTPGEIPSPLAPPAGCAFHPRCTVARQEDGAIQRRCREQVPELRTLEGDRRTACHYPRGAKEPAKLA